MSDIYNNIDNSKREKNQILENYKAYKKMKQERFATFENARVEEENKRRQFLKEYYKIRDKRELTDREHGRLLNEAKNYYFGNALKGIYIGALEAATLTDDALFLAETMVDDYIKENGGYNAIMNKVKVDTYCLAKIRRVVEDAAEEDVKNIEDGNKEIDDTEDVEFAQEPEDEKDSVEVSQDAQLTTANIEDIVSALNQAGLEVVKKNDANNFKESEPEDTEAEEIPETPAEDILEEPAEDQAPETPGDMDMPDGNSNGAEEPPVEDKAPEEPSGAEEPAVSETPGDTTAAASSDDSAEEPDELEQDIEAADKKEEDEKKEAEAEKDQEENELDRDLETAKESEDDDEDEDTMDPDAIKVHDDEDDLEGDEDAELDSDEEGDEDLDDVDDEELGDDDLGDDEDDDIDIDGDGEDDIGDVDEPEATVNVDPNKTMMDELENEKEVKDAVELIRTRVADAEEAFIKRNQEDKKQIDDLLSKISKNVATVEKISQDDEKSKAAKKTVEESTLMYKKAINKIQQDKPMSIFDKMARNISESIVKDPNKVNMFLNESGLPDFSLITETSKVMYAFLETLNTLQLESVDGPYIKKLIDSIR